MIMGLDNRLFAGLIIIVFIVVLVLISLLFGKHSFIEEACKEKGYDGYRINSWITSSVECRNPINEDLPLFKSINCKFFSRSCS